MKIRLVAIAITFSIALGAGMVFFSPNGQAQTKDNTPASIGIEVRDDEGDPIQGARITVQGADGSAVGNHTTDAAGGATVHFPRGGGFRIRTTLPAGYSPIQDSDQTNVAYCGGQDLALCISVYTSQGRVYGITSRGQVERHPMMGSTRLWVEAQDLTPEPRLHVLMKDRATGQVLNGGTLNVTRVHPAASIFNQVTNGDRWLTSLQPASYSVQWTPPAGYVPDGAGPIQLTVNRLTTLELWAKRPSANGSGTALDDNVADTGANVYVRDAQTNERVAGAELRWTWFENNRPTNRTHTSGSVDLMIMQTGDFVMEIVRAPQGYSTVGTRVVVVPDRSTTSITFRVQRNRPQTGTWVSPNDVKNTVGGQTPSTVPQTSVPETSAPETSVPPTTAPPTTAPTTEAPTTTVPTTEAPTTTAPPTTEPNNVGSTRPRCDLPQNYELCVELGLIEWEEDRG